MRVRPLVSCPSAAASYLALGVALLGCETRQGPGLAPLDGPDAVAAPNIVAPEPLAAEDESPDTGRASTGTLRARAVAAIGSKEPGSIANITVHEGDRVRKGQELFRLDSAQVTLAV